MLLYFCQKLFCRRLTFNELASAVIIFHEILSNSRSDIPLKPNEKPPHYRQFRVDQIPLLPADDKISYQLEWKLLKQAKESLSGRSINPVCHRNGRKPPDGCKCSHCGAPAKYLYLNNGMLQSQIKCKICGKTSPSHGTKRKRKTRHLCPNCSKALSQWKKSTIYKCFRSAINFFMASSLAFASTSTVISMDSHFSGRSRMSI